MNHELHLHAVQVIITVKEEPAGTQVRVDGWLGGEGVAEFARVLDSAAGPVRLLVSDLRGADAEGLAVLRRLAAEGTPLVGLSEYLKLRLAAEGPVGTTRSHAANRPETPGRRKDE